MCFVKSQFLCNELIKLHDFLVITLKQFQKSGLGADRSFGAASGHVSKRSRRDIQDQQQVLNIKSVSLADSGRLGRLVMGKTKGREIFIFFTEGGQTGIITLKKLFLMSLKASFLNNQIRVADDELRCCARGE